MSDPNEKSVNVAVNVLSTVPSEFIQISEKSRSAPLFADPAIINLS